MPSMDEVFRLSEEPSYPDTLWDKFASSYEQFRDMLERELRTDLGDDFRTVIDGANGWEGATDWGIRQLWDGFWTPHEALNEVEFWYDLCQRSDIDMKDPDLWHYMRAVLKKGENTVGPREVWDDEAGDVVARTRHMTEMDLDPQFGELTKDDRMDDL